MTGVVARPAAFGFGNCEQETLAAMYPLFAVRRPWPLTSTFTPDIGSAHSPSA
ncbi:hypothetical protein ACFXGA_32630 [Actinosynnema sp. NPDC059335]|uniref:hypothetical protein n=1 Tax=Actinosynnema sp. NPDC059335 TaxID=3346804 RepID=UPI00366BCC82